MITSFVQRFQWYAWAEKETKHSFYARNEAVRKRQEEDDDGDGQHFLTPVERPLDTL